MVMKSWILLTAMITGLLASSPSFAGEGGKGKHFGKGKMAFGMFKDLDLTSEQKDKIKAIKQETKNAMKDSKTTMRAEQSAMHALMTSGTATDEAIRAQHQKVQDLMAKNADARIETMIRIREVLTPEQRAKLATLMEKRGKGKEHRGKGRGKGKNQETDDDTSQDENEVFDLD